MTKGSVIQFLLSQVRTDTGALIGGKVYFYNPGTTSTSGIGIWLDEAATSPANNPYTLDSDGTAHLYASGKYRIVIKDAAGVTQFDRDNIIFFDFDVPYEYDVLQYGSVTFTQATIQAALTAIGTTNKVTLLLRPGNWVISSNADWSAYTNVTFKIVPGAIISHGAFTVNIPNLDENGLHQRFSGTGLVTLSRNIKGVSPDWWATNTTPKTTDMTTAVQSAVNCALASTTPHALHLTSMYLLTAPVNIDIPVDGPPYSYFKIFSNLNGGFYANTAITMLSTTLVPVSPSTVSSNFILFDSVVFDSSDATLSTYIQSPLIMRVTYTGCSIISTKLLTQPTTIGGYYIQSIYLFNNNIRFWNGTFLNSLGTSFDTKVEGNIVEHGAGDFLVFYTVAGGSITNNLMENITGTAITAKSQFQGVAISGNYFEANGLDFDNSLGSTSGLSFIGNHLIHFPTNQYSVLWNVLHNVISEGNYSNGSLHSVPAGTYTYQIQMNDYATVSVCDQPLLVNFSSTQAGAVGSADSVAETIFLAAAPGLYIVFAYITGLNSADYAATARVMSTTGLDARIVSENGAKLTITSIGTVVKVTQTSGAPQTVKWAYTWTR